MSSSSVSLIQSFWLKWKSLKLPWRRRWLAGIDLSGNTFWEFKDTMNTGRLRRIAQPSSQTHYADIKISPQWHQWLRYTRQDPPSVIEQQADVQRQSQMKFLAQQADERWAAKPSFLDTPKEIQQPKPATLPRDPGGYIGKTEPDDKESVRSAIGGLDEVGEPEKTRPERKLEKENPWKQHKGNPGESWQPQAWTPGSTRK